MKHISTQNPDDHAPASDEDADSEYQRDVVADFLRVGALGVVVIWHSTMSLFYRTSSGELSMPNPIGDYRGFWLLTWVLQVMPLFFVISGAVNATAWQRHRGRGGDAWAFTRRRVARFCVPVGILLALCGVVEVASMAVFRASFMSRHLVILIPLWTLGLLIAYAPLTPLLDSMWRRFEHSLTTALVAVVLLSDLVRFRAPSSWTTVAEVVSTVVVWLVAYQLGWVYRAAVEGGPEVQRAVGRMLAIVGFVGLVISTNLGVYPRPMVATTTDAVSNLLPTTAPIALLAMFQCGLVLLVHPGLTRWLSKPNVAERVRQFGMYGLPAYLFHMVAVVVAVLGAEALGVTFIAEPSAGWWLSRPVWFALVMALLVPILSLSRRLLDRF